MPSPPTMNLHNTIGKGSDERRVNGGADKYYTKPYIADYFSSIVLERFGTKGVSYHEPCAGAGAFLNVIPGIKGTDLYPADKAIDQADVFDLEFPTNGIIITNPPFGMNSSLAKKIFNHIATSGVKAICMIAPKTFKKASTHKQLDLRYHLTWEQDLPNDSFELSGESYNVPCVFQIWELKSSSRVLAPPEESFWITFLKDPKEFSHEAELIVAVRRAGGKAGQVLETIAISDGVSFSKDYSSSSTYFIEVYSIAGYQALELMNIEKFINNTAGVRSISKEEIKQEVNRIMEVLS